MEESTLEKLNAHIEDKVAKLNKMASDFPSLKRFSHYSQFLAVLTPTGILGAIRENAQTKKLKNFLSTKIYDDMSYDRIGYFLVEAAEDLAETQAKVQKLVDSSDPRYFGNVKLIIDALERCFEEWKDIAPEVYAEELTLKDGTTFHLGVQLVYERDKELVKMDLPKEYKHIQKNVDTVENSGNGCMVFIVISFATSLMAAYTLL